MILAIDIGGTKFSMAVFEGERIPGTEARLIGVLQNGIAVEIIPTGEQFYSPI